MNKKVETKFSLLENTRINLLERLAKVDAQKLNTPPAPGKWSVAQVIYHLNKAESNSIIYVSKKRLDIHNLKNAGLWEAFKLGLAKLAFDLPFKYKAPAVLGDMPDNVDYKTIVAEWAETRKRLKELLDSLPDDMLAKNVFKQPAAGRLNIYQMVDFMQSHFNRHLKQVERIVG
jgi:hypothetical protein